MLDVYKGVGKKVMLFSLLLACILTLTVGSSAYAQFDCCTQTDEYNLVTGEEGWYLCISKTVPEDYDCSCATATNCKWVHFRNNSEIHAGDPDEIVEKCCYTKFRLRLTKNTGDTSFVVCTVSNNWDCKDECNNNWTLTDITQGTPGTPITEGQCVYWGEDTYRDIEIKPTNDPDCEDGCSIDNANHFLATVCGASDIGISFDYTRFTLINGQFVQQTSASCPSTSGTFYNYSDANISTTPCPDIDPDCY